MHASELLSQTEYFLSRIDRLKSTDIASLQSLIRAHNHQYYELESPIISDTEYDRLFHALARLEADSGVFDPNSPTAKLAIQVSEQFQKVRHHYPMTSLDNTYNSQEVYEWNERMHRLIVSQSDGMHPEWDRTRARYYIQPKYDGLGLALVYEYGKLVRAITRGSGIEGEDVTLGALEIAHIPHTINALMSVDRMEIRGEVMMSRATFSRVNEERMQA